MTRQEAYERQESDEATRPVVHPFSPKLHRMFLSDVIDAQDLDWSPTPETEHTKSLPRNSSSKRQYKKMGMTRTQRLKKLWRKP
jgi:hypothetical protein